MQLIDGQKTAERIQEDLKKEVENIVNKGFRAPHLVAVLIGDNPASQAYVRNKIRACERTGIRSTLMHLADSTTQDDLLKTVQQLNGNPDVDGFIVQLPLPKHIHEQTITLAIAPDKDVDGFHPTNIGRMTLGMQRGYVPATPLGIVKLLEHYNIETAGKHAVVVGRSAIVGTPMSILLSRDQRFANCTVTITHRHTHNLPEITRQADILVVAIGRPNFITADMVKQGAVVIDVGINQIEDASQKRGYRLVGDVDFENVAPLCSYITPVPGGVGPMTVTALLINTLRAFKASNEMA